MIHRENIVFFIPIMRLCNILVVQRNRRVDLYGKYVWQPPAHMPMNPQSNYPVETRQRYAGSLVCGTEKNINIQDVQQSHLHKFYQQI
jgi:hypothetical protein